MRRARNSLAMLLCLSVVAFSERSANSASFTWSVAQSVTGLLCTGVDDDTEVFNALLATVNTAGGGTIYIKGTCVITGPVVFPNDGAVPPKQSAIRITGAGNQTGFRGMSAFPSALDLRYNATSAKLDTRGGGTLEIDHIALIDSSDDCATFLQTSYTIVNIHDVTFSGTAEGPLACNDAVVYGGTTITGTEPITSGGPNDPFQGYHSILDHNFFDKIRRIAQLRSWANSIWITHNTYSGTCGNGTVGGAAIELQGSYTSLAGNRITDNLLEVINVYYGVLVDGPNTVNNTIRGNGCFDGSGNFAGCVRFSGGSCFNFVSDNLSQGAYQVVDAAIPCNDVDGVGAGDSVTLTSTGGLHLTKGESDTNRISTYVADMYMYGWKLLDETNGQSVVSWFKSGATPIFAFQLKVSNVTHTFWYYQHGATTADFYYGAPGHTDTRLQSIDDSDLRVRVPAGRSLWLGDTSTAAIKLGAAAVLTQNAGGFTAQSFGSSGTTFALSGCSATSLTGGATAGSFVSGTAGACTVTITMGGSQAATHGWSCWANDITTPANSISQSGGNTATAVLTGTTAASDVVNFGCMAY
jgi:hypothetical protein